ncbi:FecCD family ABC transporter permease [Cerasicoccus arenae]|uniref:Hemin ABC transporter permease n=1 Tax=Cerasicoccus arenae TaxID=424488 RepID=A0A8J3DDU3_9BACT|nr:iron ABC transporter permease [Cerasicoccus arenae]MBK1859036.1 iron ABC transporter permease [Cerasicoccus arenae]GHB94872.1 hemin ABC transporter permease [Cerasicoccus arenae]
MPLRIPEKRRIWIHVALLFILLMLAWAALGIGPTKISWGEIGQVLLDRMTFSSEKIAVDPIIWQLRLPRIVMAILVGAGLAVAGALMQGLFRNPLADPGLIGVSSGSAMGAVVGIIILPSMGLTGGWLTFAATPICAMAGGVGITFLIYQLSRVGGRIHVASMLLTGIAVNAIGGALIGLAVTKIATAEQLQSLTFWSLGSLNGILWPVVGITAIILVPGLIASMWLGRPLNAFLFGELEAYHLGVDVPFIKRLVIVISALMVGITVAFTGGIGFIGLVAPHIIRLSFGPDHRLLLPACAMSGAILLLIADTAARTIAAPAELQIGILTAIIGGPFFLMLLLKNRKELSI